MLKSAQSVKFDTTVLVREQSNSSRKKLESESVRKRFFLNNLKFKIQIKTNKLFQQQQQNNFKFKFFLIKKVINVKTAYIRTERVDQGKAEQTMGRKSSGLFRQSGPYNTKKR